MVNDQLSIFIPTFNRWKVLSKTLAHTLASLPSGFIVRILNNNSPLEGRADVDRVLSEYSHVDCRVIDFRDNVGAEANFLRCVELCETPYLLVLGDDDYLKPVFIEEIKFYLEKEKTWGWINFQVKRKGVDACLEDRVFDNPFQMVRSSGNWAELMFISTSVFYVGFLKNGLPDAHQWQSTWSVLPLALLKGWERQKNDKFSGFEFLLSAREIVDSTGCGDAHYNQVDVYKHLPIIDRVPFNALARKKIIRYAVRGGVKDIFKPRVLVKHFYSIVWHQTFSKTLMDYRAVSQGLPYMVGVKAYFYRFYMLVMITMVLSVRLVGKLPCFVKKIFQIKS